MSDSERSLQDQALDNFKAASPAVTVAEFAALWRLALTADATLMWNPVGRFIARRRLRRDWANLMLVTRRLEAGWNE